MSKMIRIAALAVALSGCASAAPRVTIMGSASRFAAPVTFEMRATEPASDAETEAAQAVTERLVARGWTQTTARPEILVEVVYVVGAQVLGVHAGDERPTTPEDWLAAPTPRRWWRRPLQRHALSVRLVDPDTGRTAAGATATRIGAPGSISAAELADALMGALPERPEPSISPQAIGTSMPNVEPAVPAS